MNKDTFRCIARLQALGISEDDAWSLRRIAMTLHRWHEMECGDSNDFASTCLERCETTGKPYMVFRPHSNNKVSRYLVPDREAGAQKRLAKIMLRYAFLAPYIQGDPRGAALFILKPGDVPVGGAIDSYYSRGVAVYQ